MKEVKNMAYWLNKNGMLNRSNPPGINNKSEGDTNLPDGRSASSAFQSNSAFKQTDKPSHSHYLNIVKKRQAEKASRLHGKDWEKAMEKYEAADAKLKGKDPEPYSWQEGYKPKKKQNTEEDKTVDLINKKYRKVKNAPMRKYKYPK